jgi:hypothetical protein
VTNVHRPAPVNQFYRLEYDETTGHYRKVAPWNTPDFTSHDPDTDDVNCMVAEGVVALDAHSNGQIVTTPSVIRNHQDDHVGGIGVTDVAVAWERAFHRFLMTPDNFDWADTLYAVKQRRHVAIGVDYTHFPYALQTPHDFDHALGIDDYRASDGAILVFDSLGTGPRWLPQAGVRAAAQELAIRARGSAGRLFVGITASRPYLQPALTVRIHPDVGETYQKFGVYTVANGRVQSVDVRRTKGFSASADSLDLYPWPGHSRQSLVRVTSGFLKGFYVRSSHVVEN